MPEQSIYFNRLYKSKENTRYELKERDSKYVIKMYIENIAYQSYEITELKLKFFNNTL